MNKPAARRSIIVLLIVINVLLALALLVRHTTKKEESVPEPELEQSYRANYHFTVPDRWKNDPQKLIYMDGSYHYYYLYNRDYPKGNGTEWRHATSVDLVHWKDEGIAIPKYTNRNGDPWSGSVVADDLGTAGFGEGALIAIVTQPSADGGKQEQFLWYSIDKGKTFAPYGDKPVLPNPGSKDFRDPKVVWYPPAHKWVMALAEGTKIGFYESSNLKEWRYTGDFMTENIGIVECPDLYLMQADDGVMKWVLGASANGTSSGKPNTYAYWTGSFNGMEFFPDHREPGWLDYGFDWYGAVTFEDGRADDKFKHRYAMAWMNNWSYPHETPTLKEGFNGTDSIVRQIGLKRGGNDSYRLVSQPIEALNRLAGRMDRFERIEVNGSKTLNVTGDSYRLDADLSWSEIRNAGLRLRESADQSRHVDVGVFVEGGYSYVNRAYTGHPDRSGRLLESRAPFDRSKKYAHFTVFVDKTSVEVFIDDGGIVYSSLIYPKPGDKGITLFSDGGSVTFRNVVVRHFGPQS
ncbi:glycoside hydrolase family 32 protein [Paenibacillus sp. N4]|uniref:glycoside hydrolase family 32 protein n=1 Tax=Paenibacillus vietnamensis TaxID=2590547 RepID=UPI001CD15AAE|nr:glycoside hydrolase family 32 protein [Paenibacillus vietnamensis]MCA0758226.1 glycoside hydrolase family 32 protein [Paenibacillus vietnamensis]